MKDGKTTERAEYLDIRIRGTAALENMHKVLIEVLRQREEEMVRYIAILAPALGGFVWLLNTVKDTRVFIVGTIGVLLLLLLGAVYSLTLGYNYRYIILELAKLEAMFQIVPFMLEGWPRTPKDFLQRYRVLGISYCTPPEVIKVFWWAFMVGILGVTITAVTYTPDPSVLWYVGPAGAISLLVSLLWPIRYGVKFHNQVRKEPKSWSSPALTGQSHGSEGE